MPKFIEGVGYACSYCGKRPFINPLLAEACETSHKLVYIALPREDLIKLIQFIYTGNREILSESLVTKLTSYSRLKEKVEDVPNMPDL